MRRSILLIKIVILVLIAFPAFAAVDKWGGDTRVKNPTSKYQASNATSVTAWTLTDTTKNWTTNELAGCILQGDTSREVYWLIKSNTSNTITVYGTATAGQAETCNRDITQENNGSEQYAVLDQWSIQKVNNQWWWFDPFGNSWYMVSLNDPISKTTSTLYTDITAVAGSVMANLTAKLGGTNNYETLAIEYTAAKNIGVNSQGSISSPYLTPGAGSANAQMTEARYLPYIFQIRMSNSSLSLGGTINVLTVQSARLYDADDANFQTALESALFDAAQAWNMKIYDGATSFTYGVKNVTGYTAGGLNIAANPWFIGVDWDEEPGYMGGEGITEHIGYRIITAAGTWACKIAAESYLEGKYTTIDALNTAWGTAYADWAAFLADTGAGGINGALSNEPYVRTGIETNTAMKADIDEIALRFMRNYYKKIHDALDNAIGVHKINVGSGNMGGWKGSSLDGNGDWVLPDARSFMYDAVRSADGTEYYMDVVGVAGTGVWGASLDGDPFFKRVAMMTHYQVHQRPYFVESYWADSPQASTYQTGTVTSVTDQSGAFSDPDTYDQLGVSFSADIFGDHRSMYKPNKFLFKCNASPPVFYNIMGTLSTDAQVFLLGNAGTVNPTWTAQNRVITNDFTVGDTVCIIQQDGLSSAPTGWNKQFYIPLTQEARGTYYGNVLTKGRQFKDTTTGDYIFVGASFFSFLNDRGWRADQASEAARNFGIYDLHGNLYDGSVTIANGATQNCGDFVTNFSSAALGVYDVLIEATTPPTVSTSRPAGRATGSPFPAVTLTCADCASMLWCSEVTQGVACTPAVTYSAPFKTPGQNRSWFGYCYNGTDAAENTSSTVCVDGKREKRK